MPPTPPPARDFFLNGAILCVLVYIWIRFFFIYKINILDTRLLWGNSCEKFLKTFYD